MKRTEKSILKTSLFNRGANYDANEKFVGATNKVIQAFKDAHNLVVRGINGFVLKFIGGEQKVFGNIDTNKECIYSCTVCNHVIEVWCEKVPTGTAPLVQIKIDGLVMVETDKTGWDTNHPLQGDTNDNCGGGEFYVVDFQQPIYIWDVQDIIDCYNSTDPLIHATYFANFNPLLYQAVLNLAPHHPVFREDGLVNVSGAGLPPGKYAYSIRYADSAGNRTMWSVETPYIPVPGGYVEPVSGLFTNESPQHPGIKNYGADSNITPFNWGIQIQFRVDNVANYEYIEIRRVSQNTQQAYNYVPTAEKIKFTTDCITGGFVNIQNQPWLFSVVGFQDDGNVTGWEPLDDTEDTEVEGGWFTCKTLRYYQNRLVAMNIALKSKDVTNKDWFITKNNKLGFPVMEKLTTKDRLGHYKPWNQVYYPTEQSGEIVGWGAEFIDDYGNRSLTAPIDNLAGVDMKQYYAPNRREPLDNDSFYYSHGVWKGAVKAADIYSGQGIHLSYCHEVIDLDGAISRDSLCRPKNIMNQSLAYKAGHKVNDNALNWIPHEFSACSNLHEIGGYVSGTTIGHAPFAPINDVDNTNAITFDHNFRINDTVDMEFGSPVPTPTPSPNSIYNKEYHPAGFAPNYYAQGMALWGLKEWPDWARGVSIVRTKPAGRVICQGIGFPSIRQYNSGGSTYKNLNEILFWSPDADSVYPETISWQNILNGLMNGGYQIQLVSPLGAFSEVYDGEYVTGATITPPLFVGSRKSVWVDMIVYVRQLFEDGSINPTFGIGDVGQGDGYVSYGRWLNNPGHDNADVWKNIGGYPGYNGNHIFDASNVQIITDGRSTYLQINTVEDIYKNGTIGHSDGVDLHALGTTQVAEDPRNYCEPFYIINIIAKDKTVSYANATSYNQTGHILKFDSKIGIWNTSYGNNHSFDLVDERWEDCIPNYLNPNVSSENRYVFVNGVRWINCTYFSAVNQNFILNQLNTLGVYTDTDGNPCYGVYMNTGSPGLVNKFSILFHNFNNAYPDSLFIPPDGATISIRYDNRVPIKIFAGEKTVGESVWCPYDRLSTNPPNHSSDPGNNLPLIGGFPYSAYHINDRVYLYRATTGSNNVQDYNKTFLTYIRQLMVNCHLESRVNIPLMFDFLGSDRILYSVFPHTHYVMRPHRWDATHISDTTPAGITTFLDTDNHMWVDYYNNYGLEWLAEGYGWRWGGFKFSHSLNANIDYGKILNDRSNTSTPIFGFKEVTKFCTRAWYSNKRPINIQDSPSLKTFPSENIYDIEDAQGEIKYAYDDNSEKGNNLIAFTDHGVCLLLTDKRILSDFTGTEIANIKDDTGFLQGEYWLSKQVGMSDEFWRMAGEGDNQIIFGNRKSIYRMSGLSIEDILKSRKEGRSLSGTERETSGYYGKVAPFLKTILQGYGTPLCGVYDQETNEYMFNIGAVIIKYSHQRPVYSNPITFHYANDADKQFWCGENDYNFNKLLYVPWYLTAEKKVWGLRDFESYRLSVGNIINGKPATAWLIFYILPQLGQTTEFIDNSINANEVQTLIEYSKDFQSMPEAFYDIFRNYGNQWYNLAPRKTLYPHDRLQGDLHYIRITWLPTEGFVIESVETGFKAIKD